jgi:hypothetical protein
MICVTAAVAIADFYLKNDNELGLHLCFLHHGYTYIMAMDEISRFSPEK